MGSQYTGTGTKRDHHGDKGDRKDVPILHTVFQVQDAGLGRSKTSRSIFTRTTNPSVKRRSYKTGGGDGVRQGLEEEEKKDEMRGAVFCGKVN